MQRIAIKKNQIWKHKLNGMEVLIHGKKGVMWKSKVLTDKPDVFAGTHTFNQFTLWRKFELLNG